MRALAIAVLLVGCGGDDVLGPPAGPHYQYVMSDLKIPTNNNGARDNGLDLNGDKAIDNQLGMVFGTLSVMGLGVDGTAREAVLRGGLTLLADVQTIDFAHSDVSGVTTYLGRDPTPAPCLDPAQLDTCGQHLHGGGHFSIEPDSESDLGTGPLNGGVFSAGMDVLPIEIALDVNAPLRLNLDGARVKFTAMSEDGFVGVIGGLITSDDVDRVIIPQAALEMQRIVGGECHQPTGIPPCGCPVGARSELLQHYMDKNDDCAISLEEVAKNDLVQSLLAPDVRNHGEDKLSFGVGVEFRRATFE